MSFWSMMNYVAWGLCALLAYLILSDFIKVELARKKEAEAGDPTSSTRGGF